MTVQELIYLLRDQDSQQTVLVRWEDFEGQAITFTVTEVVADQGVVILESEVSLS